MISFPRSARAMSMLLTLVSGAPLVLAGAHAGAQSSHLVISQIYGGGGNSGATYKNDFIELYNPTSAAISLSGYSVQYASASQPAGSPFTGVTPLTGTVPAGKYYLVQESQGTGGTTALPTPDDTGTIAISATAGKVALVMGTAALSPSCPSTTQAVDFVGWGTANCSSNDSTGTNDAPATTNTTSIALNSSDAYTAVTKNDFTTGAPNPRNSTNSGAGTGTGTQPTLTPISTIQANRATYVGQAIMVRGIIKPSAAPPAARAMRASTSTPAPPHPQRSLSATTLP